MEYNCSICDKIFLSKKNLLKHNRNVHEIYCIDKHRRKDEITNCYNCQYCKNEYRFIQSRWQHEKRCKIQKERENEEEAEKIKLIKEENIRQKQQIIELQQKLLKTKKLDNKTFKALNKILIERSNINSNNNNTINNNTINNYQIVSIGNEDLLKTLTMQQKQQILNSRLNSLEKLVEITHCGELNQFKNIIITNLKDNYAYRYDAIRGYFIAVNKNTLLDNLVMLRLTDIEAIYDELKTANKIDDRTKKIIQNFLDKMENTETPVIENDTKYENYKSFKIDNIKILLYNNQDKITKNIALLISDNNEDLENILNNNNSS